MNKKQPKIEHNRGFTLVEILVVLVIAAVVLSIAIPQIRTVNKDRNLREAARIVGSAFANASQRASIDGIAGVRVSRNPNFIQGSRQFAASQVSILRRVPNYIGDTLTPAATITNTLPVGMPDNLISITMPLEQASLNIVRVGDKISFGGSTAQYRILSVNENTSEDGIFSATSFTMQLEVDLAGYLPEPADGSTFSIFRRPRILRSSTAELPENNIIDLRYSGFEVLDGFGPIRPMPGGVGSVDPAGTVLERQLTTVFEPAPTDFTVTTPAVENYDIDIIFDQEGSVDSVIYTEVDHNNNGVADEDGDGILGETVLRLPLGPLYFLITQAPNATDATQEIATADPESFWVTVSNSSGSANIGYNNSNSLTVDVPAVPGGNTISHAGTTVGALSTYYFAAVDTDPNVVGDDQFLSEDDRDEFNVLINAARRGTSTVSANQ